MLVAAAGCKSVASRWLPVTATLSARRQMFDTSRAPRTFVFILLAALGMSLAGYAVVAMPLNRGAAPMTRAEFVARDPSLSGAALAAKLRDAAVAPVGNGLPGGSR